MQQIGLICVFVNLNNYGTRAMHGRDGAALLHFTLLQSQQECTVQTELRGGLTTI